jgi:hypothetical protein
MRTRFYKVIELSIYTMRIHVTAYLSDRSRRLLNLRVFNWPVDEGVDEQEDQVIVF